MRLSAADPVPAPPVRGAEAGFVLDRSLEHRVRGALRRSREHADSAADLLAAEIHRAGEPLGLYDPWWRATFAAGIVLADGLEPLQARRDFGPVLLRRIQSRLAKEAYVMHLRRLLVLATDRALQSADPARTLLDWQLAKARAWFSTGAPADNPAWWAAPALTERAPAREVRVWNARPHHRRNHDH